MAQTFGIDVSKWQGNISFDKAAAEGVKFIVVKGGGGDGGLYVDSKFQRHYTAAKAKGLPVGVYWFSKALTIADAKKEAEYFYQNVLKGRQFELPVYIDVEDAAQLALGKRLLTDIVKAWCGTLEEKGYWVGIYSSTSFFSSYMYDEELQRYAHWAAQWDNACTYAPASVLGMWQFGGSTNKIRSTQVAGVTCDQDYMLVDYPVMIKAAGKNGFTKTAASTPAPAVSTGVITGTDTGRATNALIKYTKGSTGTNQYGFEVAVDRNGIVLADPVYGKGNMTVPTGGFVLSGHGEGGKWLYGNIKQGYKVSVAADGKISVTKGKYRSIDGTDTGRPTDSLILYKSSKTTGTNQYGWEVPVVGGIAQSDPVYGKGNMAVPTGGFVLSGHEAGGRWLYGNIKKGSKVTVTMPAGIVEVK